MNTQRTGKITLDEVGEPYENGGQFYVVNCDGKWLHGDAIITGNIMMQDVPIFAAFGDVVLEGDTQYARVNYAQKCLQEMYDCPKMVVNFNHSEPQHGRVRA